MTNEALIKPERSLNSGRRAARGCNGRHEHAPPRLPLHLRDLIHRHHVVVEVHHDPERSAHQENDDQDAESQGQLVCGVVGPCGDVQEVDLILFDTPVADQQIFSDGGGDVSWSVLPAANRQRGKPARPEISRATQPRRYRMRRRSHCSARPMRSSPARSAGQHR